MVFESVSPFQFIDLDGENLIQPACIRRVRFVGNEALEIYTEDNGTPLTLDGEDASRFMFGLAARGYVEFEHGHEEG